MSALQDLGLSMENLSMMKISHRVGPHKLESSGFRSEESFKNGVRWGVQRSAGQGSAEQRRAGQGSEQERAHQDANEGRPQKSTDPMNGPKSSGRAYRSPTGFMV